MWSTRHFFNLQSGVIAYTNNYGRNGHILQYKMFGKYCHWTFCTVFKDKLIFVRYMKQSLALVFGTVFIGWNQLQIFDNDNFSIIPKSIFSDNDSLPISCKNADLSAVNNFFDNIAHPYLREDYRIGPMSDEECYVAEVGWGRRRFWSYWITDQPQPTPTNKEIEILCEKM